jgi:hypothetical protein
VFCERASVSGAPNTTAPRPRRGARGPCHQQELFFDLVYVFAFTQLSAHLYGNLSWQGGAETAVIFVALWWSWSYTSWATGWIDPEWLPVVVLLSVLMIACLVMASAIPEAFRHRGETFALAYVAMQLLRSAFSAPRRRSAHGSSSSPWRLRSGRSSTTEPFYVPLVRNDVLHLRRTHATGTAMWSVGRRCGDVGPRAGDYKPGGWRTTKPPYSPPPCDQRVPSSASATVSKRQPAIVIHTCPAFA